MQTELGVCVDLLIFSFACPKQVIETYICIYGPMAVASPC